MNTNEPQGNDAQRIPLTGFWAERMIQLSKEQAELRQNAQVIAYLRAQQEAATITTGKILDAGMNPADPALSFQPTVEPDGSAWIVVTRKA